MNIPYRTRRLLNRIGLVALAVLLVGTLVWFCWVIWLERYVVYTEGKAILDFDITTDESQGELAVPPAADAGVPIYYNEGANAVNLNAELTQLNGYYIDGDDLQKNLADSYEDMKALRSGTAVMVDMKGGYGSFYYSSKLSGAVMSQSVSVTTVDEMIKEMQHRGFYTIARISAFRDYNYGLNNVPCGLPDARGDGYYLRADDGGCYWLDPTEPQVITWLCSIIKELKELGFNEVVLDNFRFPPNPDLYIFSGDRDQALAEAAEVIISNCASDGFTISFVAAGANFALPEGRTRLYLSGVEAKEVGAKAAQANLEEPQIRLVFLADTNDTRFDEYGVLRPIEVSGVIEAQKADQAAQEEE